MYDRLSRLDKPYQIIQSLVEIYTKSLQALSMCAPVSAVLNGDYRSTNSA